MNFGHLVLLITAPSKISSVTVPWSLRGTKTKTWFVKSKSLSLKVPELTSHCNAVQKLLSDLQTQLDFVQLETERSLALERLRDPCQGSLHSRFVRFECRMKSMIRWRFFAG